MTNGFIVKCDRRGQKVVYVGWKLHIIRLQIQFFSPPHFTRHTCFLATQFVMPVYPLIHSHQPTGTSIGYRTMNNNLVNNIIIVTGYVTCWTTRRSRFDTTERQTIFSTCGDLIWVSSSFCPQKCDRGALLGIQTARSWSWTIISVLKSRLDSWEQLLHSHIRLRYVMLK